MSFKKSLAFAAALPLLATSTGFGQSFSENYESQTPGDLSTGTTVNKATIIDGSATIGSGNAVQMVDTIVSGNGTERSSALEYNFATDEAGEFGSLVYSFDIYNNQAVGSNSSFIMGVGSYDTSTGTTLSASADRVFNLEFSTTGSFIRVRGSNNADGTYNYGGSSHVTVFVNDHDTNSINYTDPLTSLSQSLAANSGAIYIDSTFVGTVGFAAGFTDDGNAGLGRIGFYSGSSVISDFTIDNLTVSAIPEPGTFALLTGLVSLALIALKRRS